MFSNNVKCDIYIGQGAGKKLLDDIDNAIKSIKIVSPYLSPSFTKSLIEKKKQGIEVHLITMDKIEDYGNNKDLVYNLINQNRETIEEAVIKRGKFKKRYRFLLLFLILASSIMGYLTYQAPQEQYLIAIPILFLVFILYLVYRNYYRNTRIYNYWYSQYFPFKVFLSPEKGSGRGKFIHSKIFIIDDEIAYLGSLNFTYNGSRSNHETRVRTTDQKALNELLIEFEDLYESSSPQIDIQQWGRSIYNEPIN